MTCCKSIVVGSVGATVEMVVRDCDGKAVDLTDVVAPVQFKYKHGNSAVVTRTAVIAEPSTGLVRYSTIEGDFPSHGEYLAQLVIIFPSGKRLPSRVFSITVEKGL